MVMLADHENGRGYIRTLARLAKGTVAMTERECAEAISAAGEYIALLRHHIQKEDQVLFPMAERLLGERVMDEVTAQFERIEAAGRASIPARSAAGFGTRSGRQADAGSAPGVTNRKRRQVVVQVGE